MTMKMFAIGLAAGTVAAAAGEIPPMPQEYRTDAAAALAVAWSINPDDYPNADYVIVDDAEYTVYDEDGRETNWDEEWVLAITEKGRRELSTIEISANRRYGDAAVQLVEIYRQGEKPVEVDFKKTLTWATDNESKNSNIYDPMHQNLNCGVPGLKKGDLRHVITARNVFKPRIKEQWAGMCLFEYTAPIIHSSYIVDAPAGKAPVRIAERDVLEGNGHIVRMEDRLLDNGRKIIGWEVRNVPQAFMEPSMPPMHTQLQRVMLSTLQDWREMSRWYWNLCKPHLDTVTDEMRAKVADLVKDCPDEISKIRAIYKFVAQEIRYMGITAEDDAPGYEPHDVRMTYENRYGVCRDKGALLAALLRVAGIDGYPVLIHAGAKLDPDVALPYFNHAITAVKTADGNFMLMDPTDESSRELLPAYLSNRSYLVATPEGEELQTSPVVPASQNSVVADTRGTLAGDGSATITSTIHFNGVNDNAYRGSFLRMAEADRKRMFSHLAVRLASGAELLSYEILPKNLHDTDTPLSCTFTAKLPEIVLRGQTRDTITLPFVTKRIGMVNFILDENKSLEERRFTLFLGNTCEAVETFTLDLGEAVGDVLDVPADASIGIGTGYSFERKAKVEGGVLSATRKMSVGAVEFTPDEYREMRENSKLAEPADRAVVAFAKTPLADADVNYIMADTETYVSTPKSWVTTNTTTTSILSYRGKKNSSELQLSWNTAVGEARILGATVVAPDDRKSFLTDKEINVMDAEWVGAAPRYPASKVMVASLPAVEIGSVIYVTEERTVTNAPVAFNTMITYDSENPIGAKTVEIHAPDGMEFNVLSTLDSNTPFKTAHYSKSVANPDRIPREVAQPAAVLWRNVDYISLADMDAFAGELARFYTIARKAARGETAKWAKAQTAGIKSPEEKILALRKAMRRSIRTAGPGLCEVPFSQAFFPPDRTLADGYGSYADKMNFFAAALEAVGFNVEVFLAANDSTGELPLTETAINLPRPQTFSTIILKVTCRTARWPFGKTLTWWLGGENEYTPLDCTAHMGDTIYSLSSRTFTVLEDGAEDTTATLVAMSVRENGTVDASVSSIVCGSGIGAFRKKYKEMLPEDRSRHYLALLGELSDNASATSELDIDTEGIPAKLSFKCTIPYFAVATDDTITVKLPDFTSDLFAIGGPTRKSPIKIPGTDANYIYYDIAFPEGYIAPEHIPEFWEFAPPDDPSDTWYKFVPTTYIDEKDGLFHVTIERYRYARYGASYFDVDFFDYLKTVNRRASSEAGRTISVRKPQ
ncbi:MAG: DUF3857 domain-containing protein [Kiritimatiellae bacterium]|nr:DUF3857 domain-containing protein [Kiritimatiellia bacterium]